MTRGLEGRRSIQLSYGGWARPSVSRKSPQTRVTSVQVSRLTSEPRGGRRARRGGGPLRGAGGRTSYVLQLGAKTYDVPGLSPQVGHPFFDRVRFAWQRR